MNRRHALVGGALGALALTARAPGARAQDVSRQTRDNVVALVRTFDGGDPKVRPVQKIEPILMKPEPGSRAEDLPVFDYFVGDLHLRYVFDDPRFLAAVRGRDLPRLGIDRAELPTLAVRNFRRLYPKLEVVYPEPGLGAVINGGQLEPCILLDASFWEGQRKLVKGEVIAAVPSRDSVVFTANEPKQNIELLKHFAVLGYEKAKQQALSRTVLVWRKLRWEVVS